MQAQLGSGWEDENNKGRGSGIRMYSDTLEHSLLWTKTSCVDTSSMLRGNEMRELMKDLLKLMLRNIVLVCPPAKHLAVLWSGCLMVWLSHHLAIWPSFKKKRLLVKLAV